MATLKDRIVTLLRSTPGLTDREITDRLFGPGVGQQSANQAAMALATSLQIVRRQRQDGKIGNYPNDMQDVEGEPSPAQETVQSPMLSEDDVKGKLKEWLETSGWQVLVNWGRDPGIDLDATKNGERWIIETKGCGSLNPMRVNYFLTILGELLQRMDDPDARYSIALPEMKQFRRLWQRLPQLAKSRTKISALFVTPSGKVEEGLKPDFGLMYFNGALRAVPQYFYGVPVTDLCASEPGLFTFLVNTESDGVEYAVSFDFDSAQVADLLRKAEGPTAKYSINLAQALPGDTIKFEQPIVVNIEAKLGKLQRTNKEDFVPFVVSRII